MAEIRDDLNFWDPSGIGQNSVDRDELRQRLEPDLVRILRRSLRSTVSTTLAAWVKQEAGRMAHEAGFPAKEGRESMIYPLAQRLCESMIDLLQKGGPETRLLGDTRLGS